MTKTAEEYRTEATAHEAEKAASWERSDTDGFLSQWASGLSAELARENARLAEAGGRSTFPALFDLNGNLVAAKLVDGRYGPVWGLLADDDPSGRFVGWVNAFPKRKATMERKGYREGSVRAQARARTWAPAGARGLGGASQVRVVVDRADRGFSRDVEVVDTGV